MTQLLGVLGSVTPPGRLASALTTTLDALRQAAPEVQSTMLDLGTVRVGFADGRPLESLTDDSAAVVGMLRDADAVLFATPVYRATFTGALKNLLDLTPIEALAGKACGIIAMGATQHHHLGVDWHLRAVLTWFGVLVAPTSVYLTSADVQDGRLVDTAQANLSELALSVVRLHTALSSTAPLGPTPLAARR